MGRCGEVTSGLAYIGKLVTADNITVGVVVDAGAPSGYLESLELTVLWEPIALNRRSTVPASTVRELRTELVRLS